MRLRLRVVAVQPSAQPAAAQTDTFGPNSLELHLYYANVGCVFVQPSEPIDKVLVHGAAISL